MSAASPGGGSGEGRGARRAEATEPDERAPVSRRRRGTVFVARGEPRRQGGRPAEARRFCSVWQRQPMRVLPLLELVQLGHLPDPDVSEAHQVAMILELERTLRRVGLVLPQRLMAGRAVQFAAMLQDDS